VYSVNCTDFVFSTHADVNEGFSDGLKYYLLSQRPEPQTQEQEDVKDWLTNSISRIFKDLTNKTAELSETRTQTKFS